MTQRTRTALANLETAPCERYVSRMLQREKLQQQQHPVSGQMKISKLLKPGGVKQQNFPNGAKNKTVTEYVKQQQQQQNSPLHCRNVLDYDEDSFVEVTVKTTNPRSTQRSRAPGGAEPWGQVLKQQRSTESIFGGFDPLRTLHFLTKELQLQLQSVLPDDSRVQQMVSDIQHTLKRVPPEIASSVHLQQALKLLPVTNNPKANYEQHEQPEILKPPSSARDAQTCSSWSQIKEREINKLMEQNTIKLEESCKNMETICTQLKDEKHELELELKRLQDEMNTVHARQSEQISTLKKENQILQTTINAMRSQYENKVVANSSEQLHELKSQLASKTALEEEFAKLKHQLRIASIEKEKYVSILAVRDRQIGEIRAEMNQLQEVINDQLLEIRNNAVRMPGQKTEDKIGDASISTIFSNDDRIRQQNDFERSFNDLPSGDADVSEIFQKAEELLKDKKDEDQDNDINKLDRFDSQASIRSMIKEIKKTAYAAASTPKNNEY